MGLIVSGAHMTARNTVPMWASVPYAAHHRDVHLHLLPSTPCVHLLWPALPCPAEPCGGGAARTQPRHGQERGRRRWRHRPGAARWSSGRLAHPTRLPRGGTPTRCCGGRWGRSRCRRCQRCGEWRTGGCQHTGAERIRPGQRQACTRSNTQQLQGPRPQHRGRRRCGAGGAAGAVACQQQ